jgi:hypothetical protein
MVLSGNACPVGRASYLRWEVCLMNSRQKEVLLVGALLVVLFILFPPWEYFDNDSSGRGRAGYHFILAPPALKSAQEMFGVPALRVPDHVSVEVDILRLLFQLTVIIPLTAGLLSLFADRRSLVKTAFGLLLIGCGLFVLCFVLWLEYSVAKDAGEPPRHGGAARGLALNFRM